MGRLGADLGPAILVEDLHMTYGHLRAVDGLSFRVERGEIYALLGPNGAGKTTTVEILEGHRQHTSVLVRVLGHDPSKSRRRLRERIGIVLQSGGIDGELTVQEIVRLATFYPAPRDVIAFTFRWEPGSILPRLRRPAKAARTR